MASYNDPLQVLETTPKQYDRDVALDGPLRVVFSVDVDRSTLKSNIRVEDEAGSTINGEHRYESSSRMYVFTPEHGWTAGTTYRVLIRGDHSHEGGKPGVRSAVGVPMITDHFITFTAVQMPTLSPPEAIHPHDESLVATQESLHFAWSPIDEAVQYELQISRHPRFEPLYIPKEGALRIADSTWIPENEFEAGAYYWRVRCMGQDQRWSRWSVVSRFTIEAVLAPPFTPGNEAPLDVLEMDAPIEVLSTFPEDGFASVGTNMKTICVHIDRPLPEEMIGPELFRGYSEPVVDPAGMERHVELAGTVQQIVQRDGTAILTWVLDPL